MRSSWRSVVALCLFLAWITPLVGVALCCGWEHHEKPEKHLTPSAQSVGDHDPPISATGYASQPDHDEDAACCQNACFAVFTSSRRHESPFVSSTNLIFQTAVFSPTLSTFPIRAADSDRLEISPPSLLLVPLAKYLLNVSYRI